MSQAADARNILYYDALARDYDLFFHNLERSMEEEGRWLDGVLREAGVGTVLDASCGSGRQAVPLARRGYQVAAADPSQAMLCEARRAADQAGVSISLYQVAFADLPDSLHQRFDAVIALGNGLCNQSSRPAIVASLQAMRRCLRPNGLCLVGIKDFDAIRQGVEPLRPHSVKDCGGRRTILFEVWDIEEPLLVCSAFRVSGSGDTWQVQRAETREYMLGQADLERTAREAGFRQLERLDHPAEAVYALR